jgi:serine/threonine protein kinase
MLKFGFPVFLILLVELVSGASESCPGDADEPYERSGFDSSEFRGSSLFAVPRKQRPIFTRKIPEIMSEFRSILLAPGLPELQGTRTRTESSAAGLLDDGALRRKRLEGARAGRIAVYQKDMSKLPKSDKVVEYNVVSIVKYDLNPEKARLRKPKFKIYLPPGHDTHLLLKSKEEDPRGTEETLKFNYFVRGELIHADSTAFTYKATLKEDPNCNVIAKCYRISQLFHREIFFFETLSVHFLAHRSADLKKDCDLIDSPLRRAELPILDDDIRQSQFLSEDVCDGPIDLLRDYLVSSAPICLKKSDLAKANSFYSPIVPENYPMKLYGVLSKPYILYNKHAFTLEQYIKYLNQRNEEMPRPIFYVIAYKIARALDLIHRIHIAHLNLRPSNILLHIIEYPRSLLDKKSIKDLDPEELEYLMDTLEVYISNFGCSSDGDGGKYPSKFSSNEPKLLLYIRNNVYANSYRYSPPERFFSQDKLGHDTIHTFDVWSYGMILLEMLTGLPFFKDFKHYDRDIICAIFSSIDFDESPHPFTSEKLERIISETESYTTPGLLKSIFDRMGSYWTDLDNVFEIPEDLKTNSPPSEIISTEESLEIRGMPIKYICYTSNEYLLSLKGRVSPEFWNMFQHILALDPSKRIAISEILAGGFFDAELKTSYERDM